MAGVRDEPSAQRPGAPRDKPEATRCVASFPGYVTFRRRLTFWSRRCLIYKTAAIIDWVAEKHS